MNPFAIAEGASPLQNLEFDAKALLRRAAEAGPGYRGRREAASLESQTALAAEIAQSGESPPAYLGAHANWVDRRAKLFEAGDYPDKGVTISASDLRNLVEAFDLPVPVLIEHAQSPLEIGFLTQVEATGHELFGNLALTEEADALIRKSGARALSLGLSRDLGKIQEVSLVKVPRVPSAKLFGGEIRFWSALELRPEETAPAPEDARGDWRTKFHELSARVDAELAERKIEQWLHEGRLFPAQAPLARILMQTPGSIDFDGESRSVPQLVAEFMERQPPHRLFSELAPAGPAGSEALFLPEEAEFYRRHFPDVSLDVIAARKIGKR